MNRTTNQILEDIESLEPIDGNWLGLDTLLLELWGSDVSLQALQVLFRVFERYPEDDGVGVFWSIIHGIEGLCIDFEELLYRSLARQHSLMGQIMLDRLVQSMKN